ncbi:helix-turn-helix domain-containing protein [Candidatus Chlorobium masyuteum]|uniref:helix-turn-helix domain-containing protein n=1 Tax=Candidatus Chlorobium masyuteum TaxID=2716876 RepID=UPI001F425B3E|nr:helix-turn-helix domain-containing protein [Candidatus Chlorobium masyuteum]
MAASHAPEGWKKKVSPIITPIHEFSATEIKALREREEVSQTVFALYMNVSKDSVSQWERGLKKQAGPTLKLLSLIKQKGLSAIA